MIARILVPLDGSALAEQALPVAEQFAVACGADLHLLRVVEVVAPGGHEPGVVSYLDEHRVKAAQEYVGRMATTLRLGRPVSAEVYLAPDAAAGILARVRDLNPDLIVQTSHAASWPQPGALGSTAAALTREAPCPVVVVGPAAVRAAGGAEQPPVASRGAP